MDYTDGDTGSERLNELPSFGTEREEVDYKRYLHLAGKGAPKDNLSFVKDCLAFMSRPDGGYLVVGVDGTGKVDPADQQIAPEQFDSSILQQKVQSYVDTQVRINCAVHSVGGRPVALIYIYPDPRGLPVPAAKNGTYPDPKTSKPVFVFREGEVVVWQGTSNVALKYAHWGPMLGGYRRQARTRREPTSTGWSTASTSYWGRCRSALPCCR